MSTARALRVVLYEGSGSRRLEAPVRAGALRLLLENGYSVTRVGGGAGAASAPGDGPMAVLGRFDAAQPAVAEGQGDDRPVFFCSVEGLEPDAVLRGVEELHACANTAPRQKWKPWFPVIDFSRCTNCMQCLTFCLFDVYGV
jgi:hypothetical protein